MGEIWRAEDTRLGRKIALKLLPPEIAWHPRSKARFLQEARAASALDHPNICSIYEVGETADRQLYLVMPCYQGEPLRGRIERGPLPLAEVLDLAGQIARGLSEAHGKGIVHRDIKPENLMVTADGTLKILDFGIAKLSGVAGITRVGAVVGTLAYMSPEQLQGDTVDERSDLWSLGVVIYEMLTGRHPFPGEQDVATREAILHARPAPPRRHRPEVPTELEKLVTALLEKDPAARIPSAQRVLAMLREVAGEASWTSPWLRLGKAGRRLGIALIVSGLALGALFFLSKKSLPSRMLAALTRAPVSTGPSAVDQRKSVAVLGFRNLSGDASDQWLGPALTEMLTAELATGGHLRVISSERTAQARQSLSLQDQENPDRESVERLHALVGADLVLTGTYLPLGDRDHRQLRLDLRILNLPTGDTMASVVEVGGEPELFDLVSRTGSKLRGALGFSPPTEEERSQARGLLPAGPEAIHLYTEALSRLRSFDLTRARDLLLRAEALEPESVVIQSALSESWTQLGQDNQARQAALRAFNGRRSLPQAGQLLIEAQFYRTGKQWDRASDTYRSLQTLYPDELDYSLKLADTLSMAGHSAEALAVLDLAHERPAPDGKDPRIDLMEAMVSWRMSDLTRTEKAAEAAVAKGRSLGFGLIIARGLIYQGYSVGAMGRPKEAIQMLRQAEDFALRAGDRWTAGRVDSNIGVILHQQGLIDEAEQVHQRALVTARELGSAVGISTQTSLLGQISLERGDLNKALPWLEESLASRNRVFYRAWDAKTGVLLASVLLAQGSIDRARQMLTDVLDSSRSGRLSEGEFLALKDLIELKVLEGNFDEALQLQDRALVLLLKLRQPSLSAGGLSLSADLLARSGNLVLARRRLALAQIAERRAADRFVSGRLLGMSARFAFREGNLSASRAASEAQLSLAKEIRTPPLAAIALRGLALSALSAGDAAGARDFLQEALRIAEKSGDQLARMETSLALARLDLDEGDAAHALEQARGVAQWNQERHLGRGESSALALSAEALLRLGRLVEAREAATGAALLVSKTDREIHLKIACTLARIEAQDGSSEGALQKLGSVVAEAGQLGFVLEAYEARLAQGEILIRQGKINDGWKALEALRKEAESKGFRLIARRAAEIPAGK